MAKLLLVDDDAVLRGVLARLIGLAGHEVTAVGSAGECLEAAAREPYDIVITDLMMPDMDGYQLTQRLRADPATRDLAILILTSSVAGPDPDIAEAAGADGCDSKTVSVPRLREKITAALEARQAARGGPAQAPSRPDSD